MKINADFSKTAVVIQSDDDWVRSPKSGVDRLMLDRIGEEVARATSIVRYAPGSAFPAHQHAKGEEFLVLEGVFSDESGDYPAGTYVRNPPGSSHAPHSENGCRILVKLRQFDPADLAHIVIDTSNESQWDSAGESPFRLPLHSFGSERVEMRRMAADERLSVGESGGGVEVLVVSGAIEFDRQALTTENWIRLPDGYIGTLTALEESTLWIKSGHLLDL